MRDGARNKADLFTRAYVVAFVFSLLAALPRPAGPDVEVASARASNRSAVRATIPSTTAPTTTTTIAPPPPLPPPDPGLGPDLERRLAVSTVDGRPTVVLTFDDGPHPFYTPRVLDILNSRGIKGVFCLVGTNIARYPSIVARIAAEGHALCNHSENHDTEMSNKDPSYVAAMMQHPSDLIRDITGRPPTFYRGPGGNLSEFIIDRAHRLGQRILGWSIDPADYFKPGPQTIQDRVLERMHPGGIVLLHDAGGERTQTVEQLAGLIDRLSAANYAFVLP